MRGKPVARNYREAVVGITPAGAGKTLSDVDRDGNKKDHPRRCGENDDFLRRFGGLNGSPPQVRGKLSEAVAVVAVAGITPAGAGKTGLL